MAAHRYWRTRFSIASGGSDIWLSELEYLAAGTGIKVAPTSSTASSTYSGGFNVTALFDGIKTTGSGWASATAACWVASDFTTPVDIEAVRVFNAWQTSSYNEMPVFGNVFLEYSDDNTNWTEQSREVVGSSFPGGDFTVGVFRQTGPNVQARYWRLSALECYSESLTLSRLELWNSTVRVCQNATITSSFPPTAGDVSTLKNEGTVGCNFLYQQRKAFPDFTWDAGAGNTMDVLLVRMAGPARSEFIRNFTLSYSTDGVTWTIHTSSYRCDLAFPGADILTEKPDADKLFTPSIQSTGALSPLKIDNTAKTINFDAGDAIKLRAAIPVFPGVRKYIEIKLPSDNTYPWCIGIVKADYFGPSSAGINDIGQYAGIGIYKSHSTAYFFSQPMPGNSSIAPGFTANSVISIAIDSVTGTVTITTSSGKMGFKDPKLATEGLFLVVGRDHGYNNVYANQDRFFTLNTGQTAYTRPPPAGYLGAFGSLYKYEKTGIDSLAVTYTAPTNMDIVGDTTNGDMMYVTPSSKQAKYEQYCGKGYIKNRVYTKGSPNNPAKKKIALFDMATNIFVAETVSDPTGLFEFKFLDEKLKYVAMALDELGQWEPACTGPLTPSIMPMVTA